MRKFSTVKKILFLLFLPSVFLAQIINPQGPVRFLALGDSYTIGESVHSSQCWPAQLMDSLEVRGYAIDTMRIIAGTGWPTNTLLNAISNKHLAQQHYNLVSVLIGVNNQFQSKPISQYLIEFPQLLDSAIRYAGGDTSKVFIVSIPDYGATPFGQRNNPSKISGDLEGYNIINKKFAVEYHIPYFNITPISKLANFYPYLVAKDGLHPSALQYAQWVRLMLQGDLSAVLEDLEMKKMEIFPVPVINSVSVFYPVKISKTLELYDSCGRLIFEKEMDDETLTVSLEELNKGIYIFRLRYANTQVIKKIMKD